MSSFPLLTILTIKYTDYWLFGSGFLSQIDPSKPPFPVYWVNLDSLNKNVSKCIQSEVQYQDLSSIQDPMKYQ